MLMWNKLKIIMFPSKETWSNKKTAQLAVKLVFRIGRKEEEFVSEMKAIKVIYVMVVRSLVSRILKKRRIPR